jgi:ABC-type Zn uptake system ZnuABC Zn-binding protein ZnuA
MVKRLALTVLALTLLAGCGPAAETGGSPNGLAVTATTTILGDVARQVAGPDAPVSVLLPVGADPHAYQPAPRDVARLGDAALVFVVGSGVEAGFLDSLIESAGVSERVVRVSDGITLLPAGEEEEGDGHAGEEGDPHVWYDPANVLVWVDAIETALAEADPDHADGYAARAEAYRADLRELDGWIAEQVAQVPEGQRVLVTDHAVLGYFAARYGFRQVGTVVPGASAAAQPSAQELAALEDAMQAEGARAVFVGSTVTPELARRVAEDAGVQLVRFYTDSLSEPEGEAGTYIEYMRYNVSAIVEALK